MSEQKLKLDDDGFTLLGDALLLGYIKSMAEFSHLDPATKNDRRRVEDQNASERVELRDVLDSSGVLGGWVYGSYDPRPGSGAEPLGAIASRAVEVVNSYTPTARLRLKDIDFTDKHLFLFGLGDAIKKANPAEMRMPLAQLGPTELTRCVRNMVISYFEAKKLDADSWMSDQLYKASLCGDSVTRIAVAKLFEAEDRAAKEEAAAKKVTAGIRLKPSDATGRQLFQHPSGIEGERLAENYGRRLLELLDDLPDAAGRRAKDKQEAERKAALDLFVLRPAWEALNVRGDAPASTISLALADYERLIASENTVYTWYLSKGHGLADLVVAAAGEGAGSVLSALDVVGKGYHLARADIFGFGRGFVAKGKIIAIGKIGGRSEVIPADWFKSRPMGYTDKTLGVSDLAFVALKNLLAHASVKGSGGPRKVAGAAMEKRLATALKKLAEDRPGFRPKKCDVIEVLVALISSKRAADRVWDAGAAPDWKDAGRPSAKAKLLCVEDVRSALQKA